MKRLALVLACCSGILRAVPVSAAEGPTPTMRGGFSKVVYGLVLELPMTVFEATMTNPPVVGTAVGLLAGTAKAVRTTFSGLLEMNRAFNPWESEP